MVVGFGVSMSNIVVSFKNTPSQFKIAFLTNIVPVVYMIFNAIQSVLQLFNGGTDSFSVLAAPLVLGEFFAPIVFVILVALTLKDSSPSRIGGLLLSIVGVIYTTSIIIRLMKGSTL